MSNLLEVAELAHRQLFPNPSSTVSVKKEEFIATARAEYALQSLLKYFNDADREGFSEVQSILMDEDEFEVSDNEIDLSGIRIMRGLPNDMWLQGIMSSGVGCKYVRTSFNLWSILDDDDCLGMGKPYYL